MAVETFLPWRRGGTEDPDLERLLTQFRERHPREPTSRIVEAYEVAAAAHAGQRRRTGEPYIHHPLAVARIVVEMGPGLDECTVAAALLHDAVEDTGVTLADIAQRFGDDVAAIVDGVTKLERVAFATKEAQQAATMRKMLLAMARDLRVLFIKLADRLHNMRTLAVLPAWKQERTARETLEIYAPLAHRLGMHEMKTQLEDLAFAALHPKRYAEIDHMVASRTPERELYLAQVLEAVRSELAGVRIDAVVEGRPKNLWSIYEKMVVRHKEFDEIFDLVGVRVIVDSLKDCYAALGAIHAMWRPVPGRFKDYVAMPKFNLYQSLHTTVVGPGGKHIEFQIRTREMHARAEYGMAAHWSYKERAKAAEIAWLHRLLDADTGADDPSAFFAALRTDLEQDEVYVFTPKGDVIELPAGATPVDFAYAIHTEVGHACIGAKVNGRLVPLDTRLTSGDTVEIVTSRSEGAGPSRDWLGFVVSHRASSKIRQWFSRERREEAIDTGREELIKALRREGLPVQQILAGEVLDEVAAELNYTDLAALHAAIGAHHVSARSVAQRVARRLREPEGPDQLPTTVTTPRRPRRAGRAHRAGVHVEGLDDVMVHLARCCTPVPGDEIMGFVTKGRGVSVHRADCTNAVALAERDERLIEVEWDDEPGGDWVVAIEVKALDRTRLLRDVTAALSEAQVNILSCMTRTGSDRVSVMRFEFEVADPAHLRSLLRSIREIEGVYDAYRVLPGAGGR